MNRLFTLSIALGLILLASAVSAADCKYKENKLDSFTKQKVVLTKWKAFRPTGNQAVNHGWMAGAVKGDKTFLALRIGVVGYGGPPMSVLEGASLLVLMADDSVVELAAYEEVWIENSSVVIHYELNAETMAALTAQGTSDIRVTTNHGDHDFNFGNKPTDRMQFVLGCVQ